jgi:hypothetical protein
MGVVETCLSPGLRPRRRALPTGTAYNPRVDKTSVISTAKTPALATLIALLAHSHRGVHLRSWIVLHEDMLAEFQAVRGGAPQGNRTCCSAFSLVVTGPLGRRTMMRQWVGMAAALALSLSMTAFAVEASLAAKAGGGPKGNVERTTSGSGSNIDRGPNFRPYGWSQGKKKGWDCRVGGRRCKPPGLR